MKEIFICHPHPEITARIRIWNQHHIGIEHSFERACKALEGDPLPRKIMATDPLQRWMFAYNPDTRVIGIYRMFLLFTEEGPYLRVSGVGVPAIKRKFILTD